MRSSVLLLPVLATTACATHAFTPSARPMPLSPVEIPKPHEHDLQLDGNTSGEVMGPGIVSGNLRYRRGVDDHVAVTGDVGMLKVRGDDGVSPNAGMTRVGVQVSGEATDELAATVFTGVGGGYSPIAGGWVSADTGFAIAGDHRYVRPILLVDAYASQPVGTNVFTVDDTKLRLPRTLGVQGLFGFDLGPRSRAVMLGLAVARLWSKANDVQMPLAETFIGLGGGFRFGDD